MSSDSQPNNPLHGIKLATILEELTEKYSWEDLAGQININCFKSNPTIELHGQEKKWNIYTYNLLKNNGL